MRKSSQYFSRIIGSSPNKFKILSSSARTSSSFCGKKGKETFVPSRKYSSFETSSFESSSFETLSVKRDSSELTQEESSPIFSFPYISIYTSSKYDLFHLSSSRFKSTREILKKTSFHSFGIVNVGNFIEPHTLRMSFLLSRGILNLYSLITLSIISCT